MVLIIVFSFLAGACHGLRQLEEDNNANTRRTY